MADELVHRGCRGHIHGPFGHGHGHMGHGHGHGGPGRGHHGHHHHHHHPHHCFGHRGHGGMHALEEMERAKAAARQAENDAAEAALAARAANARAESDRLAAEQATLLLAAQAAAAALEATRVAQQRERQARVDLVNALGLQVRHTSTVLMLGPKGKGKFTFLWLLGKGPQPSKSANDGTRSFQHCAGYLDSIGMISWSEEQLLKLLVLLLYSGVPADVLVFCSDRTDAPLAQLAGVGILHPLLVILAADFWRAHQPPAGHSQRLHLQVDANGVRRVLPEADLSDAFDLDAYALIQQQGTARCVTHHDDIDALVAERQSKGIKPFAAIASQLGVGGAFAVVADPQANGRVKENVFKLLYLFVTKYNKDELSFVNHASIDEF